MVSHATILKGAALAGGGRGAHLPPTILRLDRPDFVPHLLSELQSTQGRGRLESAVQERSEPRIPVKLEQPVHRAFNLVLAEALCLVPGEPRVDPARIESAGLVVRRQGKAGLEGWLKQGGRALGWQPLPGGAGDADSAYDPDPERRRPQARRQRPAAAPPRQLARGGRRAGRGHGAPVRDSARGRQGHRPHPALWLPSGLEQRAPGGCATAAAVHRR